jgi:hypothetical protein
VTFNRGIDLLALFHLGLVGLRTSLGRAKANAKWALAGLTGSPQDDIFVYYGEIRFSALEI